MTAAFIIHFNRGMVDFDDNNSLAERIFPNAKQFVPNDKKNYTTSYCTNVAQGNVGFPFFPEASYCVAKR